MGTTGSITVDLDNISNAMESTMRIAENVTGGVADQGALIGLAIGVFIAISLFVVLIFFLLGVIPRLMKGLKNIRMSA